MKPFSAGAVVLDNGRRHAGHAELQALFEEATTPIRAIFTPYTVRHENGPVVLKDLVHGDFKGSPIRFTLENDDIKALKITA